MKITESRLRQIIHEEIRTMKESTDKWSPMGFKTTKLGVDSEPWFKPVGVGVHDTNRGLSWMCSVSEKDEKLGKKKVSVNCSLKDQGISVKMLWIVDENSYSNLEQDELTIDGKIVPLDSDEADEFFEMYQPSAETAAEQALKVVYEGSD